MKILLLSCLLAIGSVLVASDSLKLSGTWKASVKGDYYYYIFNSDSGLTIIHGKDTTRTYYSIDTSKSPMFIDLKVLDPQYRQVIYIWPGILEMITADRIRFRMSANEKDRPKNFMPRGNPETFQLIRQIP